MNAKQVRKLRAHLKSTAPFFRCPACGQCGWKFGDIILAPLSNQVEPGAVRARELAEVYCAHCHFVLLFDAGVIGLTNL